MLGGPIVNRRRMRRSNIMWPAALSDGTQNLPCTIVDVSDKGARLEMPYPVAARARVTIQCAQFGSLDGVVMWRRGSAVGVRFNLAGDEILRILAPLVPGIGRRVPAIPAPDTTPPPAREAFGRKAE